MKKIDRSSKVRTGFRFSRITLKTTLATVRIYRAIKTYMIICNQDIKNIKNGKVFSFQFSNNFIFVL